MLKCVIWELKLGRTPKFLGVHQSWGGGSSRTWHALFYDNGHWFIFFFLHGTRPQMNGEYIRGNCSQQLCLFYVLMRNAIHLRLNLFLFSNILFPILFLPKACLGEIRVSVFNLTRKQKFKKWNSATCVKQMCMKRILKKCTQSSGERTFREFIRTEFFKMKFHFAKRHRLRL